jgi:hypothetical protein
LVYGLKGVMKLGKLFAASFVLVVALPALGFGDSAMGKPKAKKKVAAPKAQPPVSAASRTFTCTGEDMSKLSNHTVTGTVGSDSSVTNVTVTKNYVQSNGAIVNQPAVVLNIASPKRLPERDPLYKFVSYELNKLPQITPAEVDKFFFVYEFRVPQTMPAGPEFTGIIKYDKYKGYEGSLANDQRWYSTDLAVMPSPCSYTS